jgi:hypothetical protein
VQQGSSLATLASLRSLNLFECSGLGVAALAHVAHLTRLTFLDIGFCAKGAEPAQLAQLTNLQELRLGGYSVTGQAAAALLDLPSLRELHADRLSVQHGQDVSSSAITRLVLKYPKPADLQSLPQLPALQTLIIGTARAGAVSHIRVQHQLMELVVGQFDDDVQAGELAAALQGLRQLRVLELGDAACFDRQCLLAVAGMPQLLELWLDGGSEGLAPGLGNCLGVLHRCCGLRDVTLQRCGTISKGALIGLVSQAGMRRVVLMGGPGSHLLEVAVVSRLKTLGATFGCELLFSGLGPGPRCAAFYRIADE